MKVMTQDIYIKGNRIYLQNIVFMIASLLILIGSLFVRNEEVESQIVPYPNNQIVFSTSKVSIEQTWAPYAKRMNAVGVSYVAHNDFYAKIKMTVYTDKYEEITSSVVEHSFLKGQEGELEFAFDTINVDIGSRYRFQMNYCEESEEGELFLAASDQYSGCSVDGEKVQGAVALKMNLVKNSKLYWLVCCFFPIFAPP